MINSFSGVVIHVEESYIIVKCAEKLCLIKKQDNFTVSMIKNQTQYEDMKNEFENIFFVFRLQIRIAKKLANPYMIIPTNLWTKLEIKQPQNSIFKCKFRGEISYSNQKICEIMNLQ